MTPCREHVAHQRSGLTCTTMRRPQCVQNRGGSKPGEIESDIDSDTGMPVNGLNRCASRLIATTLPCRTTATRSQCRLERFDGHFQLTE